MSRPCSFLGQVALFYALGLVPIRQLYFPEPCPLDNRRVVLLVPKPGIQLLNEFTAPEVNLSLTVQGLTDNHFASIHMANVHVRRGSGQVKEKDDDGWLSLSSHLLVRDTREDDPHAELMVSAVVPTFALMMAPLARMELQLCPPCNTEVLKASKKVQRAVGGVVCPVFYSANLADTYKTAILTPGGSGTSGAPGDFPLVPCPEKAVSGQRHNNGCHTSPTLGLDAPAQVAREKSMHDNCLIEHSITLVSKADRGSDAFLVYLVNLRIANNEARALLAEGVPLTVPEPQDPCSARVALGSVTHTSCFPFPVEWKAVSVKFCRRDGYVRFTVPPLAVPVKVPFSMMAYRTEGQGCRIFPSSWCFPPSVPLTRLPRVDLSAEWAYNKVGQRYGKG